MQSLLQSIKQEPIIFMARTVYGFAGKMKKTMIAGVFMLICAYSIEALSPLVLAYLINTIQLEGIHVDNYLKLIGIAFLVVPINLAFLYVRKLAVVKNMWSFYHACKNKYMFYMVDRTLALPISWHADQDSGDVINKVQTSSDALMNFSFNTGIILRSLVKFTTSLIAIIYFVGYESIWILIFLVIIFMITISFDRKIVVKTKQINKITNKITATIFDALSNVSSVVILNIRSLISKTLAAELVEPEPIVKARAINVQNKWLTNSGLFYLCIVFAVLSLYIWKNVGLDDAIAFGTLSALLIYLERLNGSFSKWTELYSSTIKFKADYENADFLRSAFDKFQVDALPEKQVLQLKNTLSLKNLNFNYQSEEEMVSALKNLSLEIKHGQKVALIGQSGSGKTTFLKVLHGLYEGVEGTIEIDGTVISKQLHEIDLGTTLVPQEPELFSSSVTENITFGLDYSEEDIRTVTDLAMFTDVAEHLPNGFDSKINEKGVNLSGGQKQRLALARALLFAQDKDIILLDESTSSVDPETEVGIYQNIFNHFSGKTFIASIHKMNLLKYFDRIIMFDQGSITDQGSFSELLENNQQFKALWESYIQTQS